MGASDFSPLSQCSPPPSSGPRDSPAWRGVTRGVPSRGGWRRPPARLRLLPLPQRPSSRETTAPPARPPMGRPRDLARAAAAAPAAAAVQGPAAAGGEGRGRRKGAGPIGSEGALWGEKGSTAGGGWGGGGSMGQGWSYP